MEAEQVKRTTAAGTEATEVNQPTEQLKDIQEEIQLLERIDKPPIGVIYEVNNQYCIDIERGKEVITRKLSNFVMKPLSLITSVDGGQYTMRFTHSSGKVSEKQFKSSVFASARTFKSMLNKDNAELSFLGTDTDLEKIKIHMLKTHTDYIKQTGKGYIGLHEDSGQWLYIGKDATLDKDGKEYHNIIALLSENSIFDTNLPETEPITKDELMQLSESLFAFNTYTRTVPIMGWCAVVFLKERLQKHNIKMSHLLIHGTAGSGKSETEENVISPIFGLRSSPISCGEVKKFALVKSCSSSNLLPVILEEYKPAQLGVAQQNIISQTLRSAYDGQSAPRGNPDQTVTNYEYRAPIVMIGESSTSEKAIKERTIEVLFGKHDRESNHTNCFMKLRQTPELLTKLGRSLLNKAMSLTEDELLQMIDHTRQFDRYESRNNTGLSNVYLGMKLIQSIYSDLGVEFPKTLDDKAIKQYITGNMEESLEDSGITKSAVEQILESIDTMVSQQMLPENCYRIVPDKNELYLYLKILYSYFGKYYKEYNLQADVEFLSKTQFGKQLRTTPYFKTHDYRLFRNGTGEVRYKCYVLHLDKIQERLEVSKFRLHEAGAEKDGFYVYEPDECEEVPFLQEKLT